MKICNGLDGVTVTGYAKGYWSKNTLEDVFFSITEVGITPTGQWWVGGLSRTGSPTFTEDGCPQGECSNDCNYCNIAQRESEQYILPRGLVLSFKMSTLDRWVAVYREELRLVASR